MYKPLHSSIFYLLGVSLLGILGISACEEPIAPPFEIERPKLIISSNFSPDDKVSVRLTASQPIVGERRLREVSDAHVSIMEGNEVLERLHFVAGHDGVPGLYRTMEFEPLVGRLYTLHAAADGYDVVSAQSSIPSSVAIKSLLVSDLSTMTVGQFDVYDFNLIVDYEDPDYAENYYDLRLSQVVTPFWVSKAGDTMYQAPIAKSLAAPGQSFSEETTAGEASVLNKDKPAGGVAIQLQSRINPRQEILGDLIAELRTVSKPYYDFQRLLQREGQVFNGLSEPAVTVTTSFNVNSGYGVFAGYSRVKQTFSLVD